MEDVFHNIRAECARKGLTTTGFCEKMGIGRKTWYRWMERGDFPTSFLMKTACYLHVSADVLLGLSFDN